MVSIMPAHYCEERIKLAIAEMEKGKHFNIPTHLMVLGNIGKPSSLIESNK
jgi:hypothetical protein